MGILRYLVNIPLLILLVWILFDANPTDKGIEFSFLPQDYIKVVPALLVFFVVGYLFARLDTWFAYYPLRKALRQQKKANRILNKEHEKLNATVSDLKQNIEGLQEKSRQSVSIETENSAGSHTVKNYFTKIKNKFFGKKG